MDLILQVADLQVRFQAKGIECGKGFAVEVRAMATSTDLGSLNSGLKEFKCDQPSVALKFKECFAKQYQMAHKIAVYALDELKGVLEELRGLT